MHLIEINVILIVVNVFFQVRTDDGYILSVQRIPEGRVGGGGKTKKQPVLLQHGVLVVCALNSMLCTGRSFWVPVAHT